MAWRSGSARDSSALGSSVTLARIAKISGSRIRFASCDERNPTVPSTSMRAVRCWTLTLGMSRLFTTRAPSFRKMDGEVRHVGRLEAMLREQRFKRVEHGLYRRSNRPTLDICARDLEYDSEVVENLSFLSIHAIGRQEAWARYRMRRQHQSCRTEPWWRQQRRCGPACRQRRRPFLRARDRETASPARCSVAPRRTARAPFAQAHARQGLRPQPPRQYRRQKHADQSLVRSGSGCPQASCRCGRRNRSRATTARRNSAPLDPSRSAMASAAGTTAQPGCVIEAGCRIIGFIRVCGHRIGKRRVDCAGAEIRANDGCVVAAAQARSVVAAAQAWLQRCS